MIKFFLNKISTNINIELSICNKLHLTYTNKYKV